MDMCARLYVGPPARLPERVSPSTECVIYVGQRLTRVAECKSCLRCLEYVTASSNIHQLHITSALFTSEMGGCVGSIYIIILKNRTVYQEL